MAQPGQKNGMCDACAGLSLTRNHFLVPPDSHKTNETVLCGTVEQLSRDQDDCTLCSLLYECLLRNNKHFPQNLRNDRKWNAVWTRNTREYELPVSSDGASSPYESGLSVNLEDGGHGDCCIQAVEDACCLDPMRARHLNKHGINEDLVREFLSACLTEHGVDCCSPKMSVGTLIPDLLFIDVQQDCLVQISTDEMAAFKFVALSYVWGGVEQPETVQDNVSERMQPGSLFRNNKLQMPLTLADAFTVTESLRYRYLWIDALCIVQNDPACKSLLLGIMDAIYGNADIVIVAASGSTCNAGLEGWRGRAMIAGRQLYVKDVPGCGPLGMIPLFGDEIQESKHAERGWT